MNASQLFNIDNTGLDYGLIMRTFPQPDLTNIQSCVARQMA